MTVRRYIRVLGAVGLALTASACGSGAVVQTSDSPPDTGTSTAVPSAVAGHSNTDLVNAYDYFSPGQGQGGYYFTTPSSRWRCAIVPHTKAGCLNSSRGSIGITGAPATVPDSDGAPHAPNAIVVGDTGDPYFAYLDQPDFRLVPGPAKTLPFNKILAAAGFRCNVQESGVSCMSDTAGNGFTFSSDGYTPQYTDVPTS